MTKQEINKSIQNSIQNKEPIIGVSIGNGRSAKQAMNGGADMIACLNAGRFRMGGVSSTAALLPFRNSNQFVFEFATEGPGFIDDEESYETLGEQLALPPKFRNRRKEIESFVRHIDTKRSDKILDKEYL